MIWVLFQIRSSRYPRHAQLVPYIVSQTAQARVEVKLYGTLVVLVAAVVHAAAAIAAVARHFAKNSLVALCWLAFCCRMWLSEHSPCISQHCQAKMVWWTLNQLHRMEHS